MQAIGATILLARMLAGPTRCCPRSGGATIRPPGEPTCRYERDTYTADYETVTGTRVRTPRARVKYFDLTVDDPAPPPGAN